jgi:oxygen-independent coproporphyrinogen III oxidase
MANRPSWLEARTAYLHVPFCAHHCGYCDFAVTVGQDSLVELYLEAVAIELASLGHPRQVETAFIGGGTPTYLTAPQLAQLLESFRRWVPVSVAGEFSIESTPESLDDDKCQALIAGGVTRVSIGVQSFQPDLLTALDRQHQIEQIPLAVETVRKHRLGLSLDLIFAAPGSTPADWHADLLQAIRYAPDHISTYGLTYEKGTPLWKDRNRGRIIAVDEDAEKRMYEQALEILPAAGYEHYEISNFAKPGMRCRHNERYWANDAYYGFGVGAARYLDGCRELNIRNTADYVRRMFSGESPKFQSETLAPHDRAMETMAVQLRRCEGIHRVQFSQQTGFELDVLLGDRLDKIIALGLLDSVGPIVRLTRAGLFVADGVIEDLMKAEVLTETSLG